jgi:hypothetical protein
MANRRVAMLRDVTAGLKLALRGRVQLRQDLVDFENPGETIRKIDELSEDLVRNGLYDLGSEVSAGWDREQMEKEVTALIGLPREGRPRFMRDSAFLKERLQEIENRGKERFMVDAFVADNEEMLREVERSPEVEEEYLISASEFIANICAGKKWVYVQEGADVYMPKEISWAQKGAWR